jgi:mercuric ion transport protein
MKKSEIAAVTPALGISLLPSLSCPACWPAYASILSAAGLSFLGESKYLLGLNAAALLVSLIVLLRRARHTSYGPVLLGAFATMVILSGKFLLSSNLTNWLGAVALLGAFVWSGAKSKLASCPECAGDIHLEVNHGVKGG